MSALDGSGVQFTELPPRARGRLPDYPASFVYFFRDPKARVTQSGLEALYAANPNARISQFGLEVLVATGPAGSQLTGNAPLARARAVDYTWLQAGVSAVLLSAPPLLPNGLSSLLSDNLPPRAPKRLPDYTIAVSLLPQLAGKDKFNPGQSSQLADNLPPRGPARARDYTFTASFPQELIGQDQFNPGEQLTDLPPRGPARLRDYTDVDGRIIYITAPPPPKPAGQSSDLTALYPPSAPRMRDYSFQGWYFQGLIGQDAFPTGKQSYEQPPKGPRRMVDYTFTYAFPVQFPPPQPPNASKVGMYVLDLPPYGRPGMRGQYPVLERVSLALLSAAPSTTETFQAMLIL